MVRHEYIKRPENANIAEIAATIEARCGLSGLADLLLPGRRHNDRWSAFVNICTTQGLPEQT